MKIKLKAFISLLFFSAVLLNAQTANKGVAELTRGESLFKENNAKDAVQVLEYEILNGQITDNTYNFLGLGYYQLGEYDKSLDAFKRGLKVQPENSKLFLYNMGNTSYALKDYTAAASYYSDSLNADPLFYEALLNRANALLMAGQLLSAKEDYVDFVEKCPDDPQRERIELLIKALEEEIARREEEARLLAEQNKAKWEEYDGSLNEDKKSPFMPYWEEVDSTLTDNKENKTAPEWEKIINDENDFSSDEKDYDNIAENGDDNNASDWEAFDNEKVQGLRDETGASEPNVHWEEFAQENSGDFSGAKNDESDEEEIDDEEEWLTFSDEELDEMKALEEESRVEREKWASEARRREAELAEKNAKAKELAEQQAYEDEKRMREQLLEDMRKAEDERRKKLLEDVANSLQGSDSTNYTSGAEDLIEYDLEGELD